MTPLQSIQILYLLSIIASIAYTPLYLIITAVTALSYWIISHYSSYQVEHEQDKQIKELQAQVHALTTQMKMISARIK